MREFGSSENFVFREFNLLLSFRIESAKTKSCLRFTILNCSGKLQSIFEIGLKKSSRTKIALGEKTLSKYKICRHVFVVSMIN